MFRGKASAPCLVDYRRTFLDRHPREAKRIHFPSNYRKLPLIRELAAQEVATSDCNRQRKIIRRPTTESSSHYEGLNFLARGLTKTFPRHTMASKLRNLAQERSLAFTSRTSLSRLTLPTTTKGLFRLASSTSARTSHSKCSTRSQS